MKSTNILFTIALMMSLALPALAEDGVDVFGIYFDPSGWETDFFPPIEEPFNVYIILHNPSLPIVAGFEFSYVVDAMGADSQIFRVAEILPPQSVNVGESFEMASGEYFVGTAVPLIGGGPVILVQWQFLMITPVSVAMDLGPIERPSHESGLPAYADYDQVVPMTVAETCWGTGVVLNQYCPLAVETQTFGQVKALYR